MAHAIWSGSLSFGLVNIPVRLLSATKPQALTFHLLRKEDLSPISYVKVARVDGAIVRPDHIVKGYEYHKGDYIILSDDDFKKADIKKTGSIEIMDFVNENEIDAIYFEKPYYLEPTKGAAKPYALLVESLKRSSKVGVAKYVIRNREHIGVIRPHDDLLILEQLRYDSEFKSPEVVDVQSTEIKTSKEIDLALKLIDQMTEHFNPKEYKDTYNEELSGIIQEKAKKGTIEPRGEEPKTTEFVNIMSQLKKSLQIARRT